MKWMAEQGHGRGGKINDACCHDNKPTVKMNSCTNGTAPTLRGVICQNNYHFFCFRFELKDLILLWNVFQVKTLNDSGTDEARTFKGLFLWKHLQLLAIIFYILREKKKRKKNQPHCRWNHLAEISPINYFWEMKQPPQPQCSWFNSVFFFHLAKGLMMFEKVIFYLCGLIRFSR